ncbi:MAG: DUF2520 domain-containing protein [Myxococcales bacterium]|nr:DUF2520 domain-containing protein [Myxococcales bacterium]MCB9713666.1 DUF2520 domain-containing protein [Myxococcales bacterium]
MPTASRKPVLGVFGGTFDPPHLGHAMVPAYLRLRGLADRVLVVPCADHPLGKAMAPFAERLALTRAAMAPLGEAVEVSDLEERLVRERGGPSYTLRMLEAAAEEHPGFALRLVVGTDILDELPRWHRWDEIERRFAPIVVPRAGHAPPEVCALPEVSSTRIRGWLREGGAAAEEGLRANVPASVLAMLRSTSTEPAWVVGHGHAASHAVPWLRTRGQGAIQIGARALVEGRATLPSAVPAGIWVLAADPSIVEVARALARLDELPPELPVLHGAGARSAHEVLAPLAERGHPVGTLHPICSLRSERPEASAIGRAAFGVEGDPAARALALAWVGGQPWLDLQSLDAGARRAYHAACSLAANHLAVPYVAARDVLEEQGHPPSAVAAALATLLRSALDNLLALGVPAGITGPVARGDEDAVAAHLAALDQATAELYRNLSARLSAIVRGSIPS